MKRKSISIAIVIAALAVLVNVFALKSASVANRLSVSITNTASSLIAITGTGVDSDITFDSTSGQAVLTLPTNGMQPGSSYTFYPAFQIKNNSSASRSISLSASSLPSGVTLSFVDNSGNPIGATTLTVGNSLSVGIKVDVATGATLGNTSLDVNVGAN